MLVIAEIDAMPFVVVTLMLMENTAFNLGHFWALCSC